MTEAITIFRAREIVTMNPSNPSGTHVAVREGRVLGVGSLEEVAGWGPYELDERFAQHVLIPGMIEVHAHAFEGLTGQFPYQGYFDRPAPDGRVLPGITSIEALQEDLRRLDAEMSDPNEPIVTMGFDPIYFSGPRISCHELDEVSTTRPIFLMHASAHIATVNSAMMREAGIDRNSLSVGIMKDANGEPTGELAEMPTMALCAGPMGILMKAMNDPVTVHNLGRMARQVGATMVGDMAGMLIGNDAAVAAWTAATSNPGFSSRVAVYNMGYVPGTAGDIESTAVAARKLMDDAQTDNLRFPGVKFVLDGSIQGFTAVMNWPGYFTGEDHGQMMVPPEQLVEWVGHFHRHRIPIHFHCNGTAVIDLALDTIEAVLCDYPWLDHRHTIQHSQLTTEAQMRRARNLGMCLNLFSNHIWYWGDQHYNLTVGPERANRMEPCASAARLGIEFSLHSDANITPLGPLHLAWCAVNRVTPSGRVLGEEERITPYQALWAVTQGAAYQMHLDAELGSIECGKRADFAVLAESPLDVDPMVIKDIEVWGTVVGGVCHEAERA